MNLDRMLEKCQRGQWHADDLDWSSVPKPMSRTDEMAICQYFTDMAGIERLAKALFEEQCRRTEDPVLRQIFESFIVDEERHAVVAERLARHYDRNGYKNYSLSESLTRFRPHFLQAIRLFSAEVANSYILAGELILDVALLRSINEHVDDAMSHQAMRLINRDESRHIAIDYYMVEYYGSDAYQQWLDAQPGKSLREHRDTAISVAKMLFYAKPFFQDVFFEPMNVVDPQQKRLREAFKRIQVIGHRPGTSRRPFARFMLAMHNAYNQPLARRWMGPVLSRVVGVPGEMLTTLYTEEELARSARQSFDELAEEALAAKNLH